MTQEILRIQSGPETATRQLAVLHRDGTTPGVLFLGGFKSDMMGSKANHLDDWCARTGRQFTRFDYSGHGQSDGAFLDGTISDWLEDSLAVFDAVTKGPQIVVGSSMGGWLALLLNRALQARGDGRVAGLVLLAPAVDMTRDLMLDTFAPDERAQLASQGQVVRPSDYDEPYILTGKLLKDGENHLLFTGPIETGCPVHIIQGVRDDAVPHAHATKLVSHLIQDPVTLSMIPDGDHSLSRPQDLDLLNRAILGLTAAD